MQTGRSFRLLTLVALCCWAQLATSEARSTAARDECLRYCATADTQCGSAARRAKTQCARNAATSGMDAVTLRRNNANLFCGYYMDNHCDYARHRDRCEQRFRLRHGMCMDAYTKNTAQQYLACNESERTAVAMCRQELGDCRASCQ
jgi:hypothetical protein